MEPFLVGFRASGVGFRAAMLGSEPLMWGLEVSFANNGVRRSEMWGSPSLPHPTDDCAAQRTTSRNNFIEYNIYVIVTDMTRVQWLLS